MHSEGIQFGPHFLRAQSKCSMLKQYTVTMPRRIFLFILIITVYHRLPLVNVAEMYLFKIKRLAKLRCKYSRQYKNLWLLPNFARSEKVYINYSDSHFPHGVKRLPIPVSVPNQKCQMPAIILIILLQGIKCSGYCLEMNWCPVSCNVTLAPLLCVFFSYWFLIRKFDRFQNHTF